MCCFNYVFWRWESKLECLTAGRWFYLIQGENEVNQNCSPCCNAVYDCNESFASEEKEWDL